MGFAHKSYREFLAAEFLRVHDVQPVAQRELLWIGDGPSRHVIPAHQEIAAWRSSSDSMVFEDLLGDDPVVALLSRDLPTRPYVDRARVVDALLDLVQRDDAAQLDHALLHRLDHSRLADQLRPHLAGGGENSWLVYWAASIARGCPRPELADDLLTVAENPAHYPEVRVAAVRGVTAPDARGVKRLRRLAEDDSAEVVAAALQQLQPDHLPLAEFLSLLREPEPTYVGTAWALRRKVALAENLIRPGGRVRGFGELHGCGCWWPLAGLRVAAA